MSLGSSPAQQRGQYLSPPSAAAIVARGTPGQTFEDLELELTVPRHKSTHTAAVQAFNIEKSLSKMCFSSLFCFLFVIFASRIFMRSFHF